MDVTATDIFQCCYPDSLRYNTSPCRYFANHLSDTFGSNNAYPHRYVYCTGTDHDSGIPHDFQAFRNGKSHHDDIRYIDGDLRYIGYDTVLQIPTIIYKRMERELKFPLHAFYNVLSDITLFYLLSVPPLFLLPKNRLFQIAPRYCTTKSIC